MTTPERQEAFTGIWNRGLTFIQYFEYGNALSRLTAHSVREQVVRHATMQPKKQTTSIVNSTVAPALLPVAW